jgi:ABC-type sugar transport system ATPase subunit
MKGTGGHREEPSTPVLEIEKLVKNYGPIQALRGVSFRLGRGEILGLVGDNGAGKSTLVKVVAGALAPTSGLIKLNGERVDFGSPAHGRQAGIETVYQDLGLVDNLDVAANFYLGRELRLRDWRSPLAFLNKRAMRSQASTAIDKLHVTIPGRVTKKVETLSGGQRQAVAIARAAFWKQELLLLDEPTAALGVEATAEVGNLIKQIAREDGISIIVVSHDILEVMNIADKIVVLRHGVTAAELMGAETTGEEVVGYLTGTIAPQIEGGETAS